MHAPSKFTQADYLRLPEGFPAQLVDGELVKEPAPTYWHQEIVGRVFVALKRAAPDQPVIVAPADVFIDEWNVLQPDVLMLEKGAVVRRGEPPPGLPVLVVEVLSPWTAMRDRDVKVRTYLRAGIREVWLVDPDRETVEVLPSGGETSRVLPGFSLSPVELFRA